MKKIAIVGSPGSGKTTLARDLDSLLKIKIFHLDRVFWERDWKRITGETRIVRLQKCATEERWIIEGFYINSFTTHLEEADTIIFLDLPPFLCLQRIVNRHKEYRGKLRRDLPKGCTDKLTPLRMLKVLLFPLKEKRKLEQLLDIYESRSKSIIRLRSTEQVENFLAEQAKIYNTVLTVHEKLPVLTIR